MPLTVVVKHPLGFKDLVSVGADAKTVKGEKYGVRTAIVYMAPSRISGYQVCPLATTGCGTACLYSAGMGAFTQSQNARIARTRFFFEDRDAFTVRLLHELELFVRAAKRAGMMPAIRLNGTSDIPYEKVLPIVFETFADVQFYDYTKLFNRKDLPANYHLTYSLAESALNWAKHLDALDNGMNVAVVLRGAGDSRHPKPFPRTWYDGRRLIDGDVSDLRFKDRPRRGAYVGLRAKGLAIKDRTGFVYDAYAPAAPAAAA